MDKLLVYGMTCEKLYFQQNLCSTLDLAAYGAQVEVIFEGDWGISPVLLPQIPKNQ